MKLELSRQVRTLMICRLVLLTVLLVSGLIIGRIMTQPLMGQQFFLLIGAGYGLTILYALVQPLWSGHPASAYVQVTGDIVLVTGFVYVTGGLASPFSILYFLTVISAGIMLGRAGAIASASCAWLTYCSLVLLIVYGLVPEPLAEAGSAGRAGLEAWVGGESLDRRVVYSLFSHFIGFFAVAHLSSYLSAKLKSAGEELEENREALAKAQALNRDIVDSITSGIITTDPGGAITFMNRGAEEMTGRSLADSSGTSIEEFFGTSHGFLERLKGVLDKDGRYRFETPVGGPGGATIFLGVSSAILRTRPGEQVGYIFSFQDLTEIKALEEEVRLKERMAALGEMAAGIAHEIRNPLASMSGSAQILKKTLHGSGEEEELLDIVMRESRRLDGIIRDFLLFAKPGRFSPEPADLAPLLQESITLLRNSDEFRDHRIVTDLHPALAVVDTNKMKQVFWNLAKNAVKAMRGGGTLRVGVRREHPGAVVVTFLDEGSGMTNEEIQKAFEPFQSSFDGGTGLGLAVVFRIVQEHGGNIKVRSRPGEGTEVTVILPAAADASVGHGGMALAAGTAGS